MKYKESRVTGEERYSRIIGEHAKDSDYIILIEQSAVKTFNHPEKDLDISLAGVTHLGNEEYFLEIYDRLNILEKVLYENAGAGKLSREEKNSKEYQAIKEIILSLNEFAKLVGLCRQGQIIDPQMGDHWEHCDLNAKENLELLRKHPEEFEALVRWRNNVQREIEFLKSFPDDKHLTLEFMMENAQREQEMSLEDILTLYPFAIKLRDEKVKARVKEIVDGGVIKTLGIIYGSLHMPDLEDYIRKLGFNKACTEWFEAFRTKKKFYLASL